MADVIMIVIARRGHRASSTTIFGEEHGIIPVLEHASIA